MQDDSFEEKGRFTVSARPVEVDPHVFWAVLKRAEEKLELDTYQQIDISFVDCEQMQEFNREYRGRDAPTDVLSFEVPGVPGLPGAGDIVLCMEAMEDEWGLNSPTLLSAFLTLHGLLHLCGYTHETEEKRRFMIALQLRLLEDWFTA